MMESKMTTFDDYMEKALSEVKMRTLTYKTPQGATAMRIDKETDTEYHVMTLAGKKTKIKKDDKKILKVDEEALNEADDEMQKELKRWDSTMKIVHTFWNRKKGKMNVKQLKKFNDALEKIAAALS